MLQADPALYAIARSYFPTDDYRIAPKRVFRLTRDQLDVTVRALLPGYVKRSIKTSMPRDPLQTNYEYAEILSFNAANLAPLTTWIGEIASSVRERPQGVIVCPPAKASGPCHVEAATRFIAHAFRGDIDQARQQRIVEFYAAGIAKVGFAQATADLVEVTLSSPGFLFRKELDVDGASRLTPVQRLQALTYTLADAPPESLKLTSAKATEYFASPQSTGETVKAVLARPETRQKLVRFVRAWLEIKDPREFTISKKLFPEFNDALAEAMVAEANRFLTAVLGSERPRLRDLTQARQSFPSNALEAIYATKIGSPDGSQPTLLDPRQRLGVFSLPAVLASHSGPTDTRPIKRGTFWVRKAMCMEMGAVPQGLDISLKDIGPSTERRRIENSTQLPACAGCHKLIDPLGFFQEHYDPLGRWRTTDNGFPVDASMKLQGLDEGPLATSGPVEALQALTSSAMFKQCFVRQLYRFYMGRQEEPADDPLLRRMFFNFARGDSQDILQLLETMANSERITRRE